MDNLLDEFCKLLLMTEDDLVSEYGYKSIKDMLKDLGYTDANKMMLELKVDAYNVLFGGVRNLTVMIEKLHRCYI